MYSKDWLICLL